MIDMLDVPASSSCVPSLFLIIFILENERSPLQLETIITKYILSVISTPARDYY
jgi:hypothetical protein